MVEEVQRLRRKGLSLAKCAEAVGLEPHQLRRFVKREEFKCLVRYLQERSEVAAEQQLNQSVKMAKREFMQFAPDAIDYYKTCFKRDADGDFVDDAKAMWATEKVSKGLGLTEPEQAVRPVVNIAHAVIMAESHMLKLDDQLARENAQVVDVTPLPPPDGGEDG